MPIEGLRNIHNATALIGLPRSGTTLLSRLIEFERAISLSEPFLHYLFFGFNRWIGSDGCEKTSLLPPAKFIENISNKDTHVIFKETWRKSDHPLYPSESFIEANIRNGVRTIAIIRDPRDVWESQCKYCDNPPDTRPDVHYLKSWVAFSRFVRDQNLPYVRYEDLVSNPSASLEQIVAQFGLKLSSPDRQLNPTVGLGDPKALTGEKVVTTSINKALKPALAKIITDFCGEEMALRKYST